MTAAGPARDRGRAVAAAALGLAAAAGQAPFGLWPLTLLALAGLLGLVAGAPGPRRAALWGWLAGAGHFGLALAWLVEPFLVEPDRHGWMAPFAVVLMAGGLALLWAGAAAGGHALGGGSAPRRAVGVALALAFAEYLRGHLLTGFPWAMPGHAWVGTPLAQVAALAGATGLTALTFLLVALPAVLGPGRRGALAGAGLAGGLVALLWAGGAARLAAPLPAPLRAVAVRLVQPDAPQHLKWQPGMAAAFMERLLDLTEGAGPAPDLVVWPETAVPFVLPGAAAEVALPAMARAAGGAMLAFGVQRAEGDLWLNSLAVLDPAGAIGALYDKHHLVPFGEYIPFGEALGRLGIRGLAVREGWGYAAGPGPRTLDLGPAGRVLPLICYEAVFPAALRSDVRPDWILQITNDGWFGAFSGPYQHLAQAQLRAIESGLPLLRAANTGVSAAIDARGRIVASLPLGRAGALDVTVPAALPPTPYARAGDLPLLVLGGLGALALALCGRSRDRA
ncbi:MAG: apolipoprotein N-acyltransferase [Rhodobacteraceae bacterium]|nr:apolipoprotein N-acyltransferase [Paracoccaceae bacterium]